MQLGIRTKLLCSFPGFLPRLTARPATPSWLYSETAVRQAIDTVCPGYSGPSHWAFFQSALADPIVRDICVLGVYQGRDIAYMAAVLERMGRAPYAITGVDKFEDAACADWPEGARGLSWREAGFGDPPALSKAAQHLQELGFHGSVSLVQALAEDFLIGTASMANFDLIYIDTSHDYATTLNTIRLAMKRLRPTGIVAGDDFSDEGTWGVMQAVREAFGRFDVHDDWIWSARPEDYRAV